MISLLMMKNTLKPNIGWRIVHCNFWSLIRTNDYCKDKDKEVNAASVVNVSEQETHGSQERIGEAVNENEN